ncbi:MAG: sensor histidine kinase [Nitriliruptorales bacterium]|nr:sensor histidine kinase [Nitriliruptorales bacterium]
MAGAERGGAAAPPSGVRVTERWIVAASRSPIALGRLLAVIAAVAVGMLGSDVLAAPVAVALVVYGLALAPFSETKPAAYLDVVVSAGVLLAYSSDLTPFLALSVVAAYNAGRQLGPLRGAGLSWALSVAQLPTLIPLATDGELTVGVLAGLVALHPITAAASGLARQRADTERSDREVLEDTNRVLQELNRIADRVPAGLDPRSVSRATLDELVSRTDSPRSFLFAGVYGILRPIGAHGQGRNAIPLAERDIAGVVGDGVARVVANEELPPPLRSVAGSHDRWIVAALRVRGRLSGALVAALPQGADAERACRRVEDLADEAALALDNARLFSKAQARAVDTARRRIAHDLHDGVAQSLAHIRMELDLLSRADLDESIVMKESRRLADVAGRALDDVRSTITGLRSTATDEGMVAVLRDHIEGLRGMGGPEVSFEAVGTPELDPADEDEIIRIAQEATSNAVRHSQARTVLVTLEAEGDLLSLIVEDDGRGIPDQARPDGVGLRAMRARAERLGAQLTIRDRRGGGTVVLLTYQPNNVRSRGGSS